MATDPMAVTTIDDGDLHIIIKSNFLCADEERALLSELQAISYYRVKYKSERFGNECETPCWTNYFGGIPQIKDCPFVAIPPFLQKLSDRVATLCNASANTSESPVVFNSVLVRFYLDGNDNIAWHTDGRTFLGPCPTIGSLSLGGSARFQLRRMNEVWPKGSCKDAIDTVLSHLNNYLNCSVTELLLH